MPSTIHEKRRSCTSQRLAIAANAGVSVATMRCAADLEIWKTAASSRTVRCVRNAAQTISTRQRSEHDQGRPRRDSRPILSRMIELVTIESSEDLHVLELHCQGDGVGSICGVVREADTWSEQAETVVAE